MAKKRRSSGINKTALITQALTDNPTASPKEIAAMVGNDVTAKYVSTVKSNAKASGKKKAKRKPGRPAGVKSGGTSGDNLGAAISFIESAGSLAAAKQQIETIERIKQL